MVEVSGAIHHCTHGANRPSPGDLRVRRESYAPYHRLACRLFDCRLGVEGRYNHINTNDEVKKERGQGAEQWN